MLLKAIVLFIIVSPPLIPILLEAIVLLIIVDGAPPHTIPMSLERDSVVNYR